MTQLAELFKLADLTKYWNPDWKLERAGIGGAGGGLGGIRGITHLAGDVLAMHTRDEGRGAGLRRTEKLGEKAALIFHAGADAGRAWELNVCADNQLLLKKIIEGGVTGQEWEVVKVDLPPFAM